ncbi:MAG: hypothetical protein LC792_19235 [Actinobacteria bacterium]|nr:hypothetical protein [Actinomycetota bacterium]
MRRLIAALVALSIVVVTPACAKPDTDEKKLRRIIDATDRLPFTFTYSLAQPGQLSFQPDGPPSVGKGTTTEVRGVIEDDFRFKALVRKEHRAVFEKVVDDDAVAVRFLRPELIPTMIDRSVAGQVKTDTELPGVNVIDVLRSGRWVLDPVGAPSQTIAGTADRQLGVDPVTDALGVFAYVRQALNDAERIQRFSKDALDPAYRTSEDPFPQPEPGSGVTRYDLRRPKLPPAGLSTRGASNDIPQAKHFRKMAIYVKDGRIIQILERVELTGKAVDDFLTYNRTLLKSQDVPEQILKEFERIVKGVPRNRLGAILLALYAANVGRFGRDPVRARVMTLDLTNLGKENRSELPTADVVKGNLAILVGAGRKPVETTTGAQPPGASSTTSTTASP